VQDELHTMWLLDGEHSAEDHPADGHSSAESNHCHDREKPRATVEQYVALVGADVAANLEGSSATFNTVLSNTVCFRHSIGLPRLL